MLSRFITNDTVKWICVVGLSISIGLIPVLILETTFNNINEVRDHDE